MKLLQANNPIYTDCLLFSPIVENINNLNSDDVKRENLIVTIYMSSNRV
jgi:hypothetical protein